MRRVDVAGVDDELFQLPFIVSIFARKPGRDGGGAVADRDLVLSAKTPAGGEVHLTRGDKHALFRSWKGEVGGIARAGGGEKGGDGVGAAGGHRGAERRRGRGAGLRIRWVEAGDPGTTHGYRNDDGCRQARP